MCVWLCGIYFCVPISSVSLICQCRSVVCHYFRLRKMRMHVIVSHRMAKKTSNQRWRERSKRKRKMERRENAATATCRRRWNRNCVRCSLYRGNDCENVWARLKKVVISLFFLFFYHFIIGSAILITHRWIETRCFARTFATDASTETLKQANDFPCEWIDWLSVIKWSNH